MRKIVLIAFLATALSSCKEKKTADPVDETIAIEDLTLGPIVHETLSDEQLEKINLIQEAFNEVYPIPLDETLENFKRDQNPDNEIEIWMNMARSYQLFASKNTGVEKLDARTEAFELILMRSMMSEEEAIDATKPTFLMEDEIQEILTSYSLEAKPIKIE